MCMLIHFDASSKNQWKPSKHCDFLIFSLANQGEREEMNNKRAHYGVMGESSLEKFTFHHLKSRYVMQKWIYKC